MSEQMFVLQENDKSINNIRGIFLFLILYNYIKILHKNMFTLFTGTFCYFPYSSCKKNMTIFILINSISGDNN